MKKNYKIKKRRKQISTISFMVVMLIIITTISIAFSLWSSELVINGKVVVGYKEPDLPVEIPSTGTTDGITRYTVNTKLTWALTTIFKVEDETYEGNTITTSLRCVYKQLLDSSFIEPEITLTIPNNTTDTFTNGRLTLYEYNDTAGTVTDRSETLSSTTIAPSGTATVKIKCTLSSKSIDDNTYYHYKIAYDVGEKTCYFNYILRVLPRV